MTEEFGKPRTAIVTGGAKRIGAALVRALVADGWHVAIHCNRSREAAEALAAELGPTTRVVAADLADAGRTGGLVAAATAGWPAAGLLVNNASLFDYDALGDFTPEGWDRHMAVKARAPALLTQHFAAALPAGMNGLIVNLLDAKLSSPNPDFFSYTVSKMALAGLTELSARALTPRVRVAGIAPAVTMVSGPQSRENFAEAHVMNPLGRGVEASEIAAALRFIIATPTFHGQVLTLDAGQRLLGLPRDVAFMVEK